MDQDKNKRVKELEVILTICVALVVIYFLSHQKHRYLLTLSVIIGAIGISSKFLTAKISWVWLKLSEAMGAVMGRVILTIVFFVFATPVALLYRAFGKKDNLKLRKPDGSSYYTERNHKYQPADLENVW